MKTLKDLFKHKCSLKINNNIGIKSIWKHNQIKNAYLIEYIKEAPSIIPNQVGYELTSKELTQENINDHLNIEIQAVFNNDKFTINDDNILSNKDFINYKGFKSLKNVEGYHKDLRYYSFINDNYLIFSIYKEENLIIEIECDKNSTDIDINDNFITLKNPDFNLMMQL